MENFILFLLLFNHIGKWIIITCEQVNIYNGCMAYLSKLFTTNWAHFKVLDHEILLSSCLQFIKSLKITTLSPLWFPNLSTFQSDILSFTSPYQVYFLNVNKLAFHGYRFNQYLQITWLDAHEHLNTKNSSPLYLVLCAIGKESFLHISNIRLVIDFCCQVYILCNSLMDCILGTIISIVSFRACIWSGSPGSLLANSKSLPTFCWWDSCDTASFPSFQGRHCWYCSLSVSSCYLLFYKSPHLFWPSSWHTGLH